MEENLANSGISLNEVLNNNSTSNSVLNVEDEETKKLMSITAKFRITLSWQNLSYTVSEFNCIPNLKDKKAFGRSERIILHPQTGHLSNGCLMAVIGKSGSGKSTLIESLTGRRSKGLKGNISINVDSDVAFFVDEKRVKISFIPQSDALLNTLTTYESLLFASKLKNRSFTSEQHLKIVTQLLFELDLRSCKDSRVSRCSGGEKKRLSVAMELVSKPTVLVLDEPTSGLDSASALQCVQLLRKLTQSKSNPLAIMVSIHQPSAKLLYEFHKLYLLSYNGKVIYNGPVNDLLNYFNQFNVTCPQFHNPADHALEVSSGDYGEEIIEEMAQKQSTLYCSDRRVSITGEFVEYSVPSVIAAMRKHSGTSLFSQCSTLVFRTLKTTFRDPMLNYARLLKHIVVGAVLIMLYSEDVGSESGCLVAESSTDSLATFSIDKLRDIQTVVFQNLGFIFFSIMFTLYASMMPIVLVFPTEMSVFLRERTNGWYSCLSYYMAKTVADIPFLVLFTTIYASMTYYLTGQINDSWRFGAFLVISILISLIGQSVGLVVGTICVRNLRAASFIAPLSTLPFVLFSGFFLRIPFIPSYLKIFSSISSLRYAFEALVIIIYGFGRCDQLPTAGHKESINGVIIRFFNYITKLGLSYSNARPILHALAIDKNLSLSELNSFDVHFENFTLSQFNLLDIDENESLAMQEFYLKDRDLWIHTWILVASVIVLKVLTYFLLLHKANNRN
ncbi:ABC transporter-like protein 12 [Leptotrombidium deliense]|uniref:ABC transporter-like protein 12 n=1 Tax=Leptotrombidium deliense TaxID=299467 RepID=A0A443S6S5_9ACAR|nr:ABC transporter-like protein 12 [Leptotrombidium deliense]